MSKFSRKQNNGNNKKSRRIPVMIAVVIALVILNVYLLTHIPEKKAPETAMTVPSTESSVVTSVPTTAPTTEPVQTTAATTVPAEPTEPTISLFFQEKMAENPDIAAWVKIEGTKLDYPVMYTPNEPDKYLHADFNGNWSIGGVPYLEEACSMDPESDNLIIYGHNMANGTMFNTLMKYDQQQFWEEHPTISFSTPYEERTYEIISAFYDRVYYKYEDVFKFYQFIDAEDEEHFNEAIAQFKDKGLYDTGVSAIHGDKLITLVTCAYHVDNGRFVVVAKDITERN